MIFVSLGDNMRVKVDGKKLIELFNKQSKLVSEYQSKMVNILTIEMYNSDVNKSRNFIYKLFKYKPRAFEECAVQALIMVKNPAVNSSREDPYGHLLVSRLTSLLPPEDCVKITLKIEEYYLFTIPFPKRSIYWVSKNLWI